MSELRVDENGTKSWWKDGKCHRDDKDPVNGLTLPAVIYANGIREWWKDGNWHRDDKDPVTGLTLPAIIYANGIREWWKDDKCHRDDKDPVTGLTLPAIIWVDGNKRWYKDDKRHRDDKDPITGETLPAVIYADGDREWWKDGIRFYPKKIYTRVTLYKYIPPFIENCYNNGVSYITHEQLSESSDILMLPVIASSNARIKYHCYTREEVELWWKGKPDRTHPTTRVPLTDMERNMIVTFMDDDLFFDKIA